MKVSVIMCTADRNRRLVEAVRSVLDNSYEDFEFLLIDQSTTSTTRDLIKETFSDDSRLRYIHMTRKGSSRGRNMGISLATGEMLIFTDDDVIVSRDWITAHVDCHLARQREGMAVGIVGGPIRGLWEFPRPRWWPDEFLYALTEFGIEPDRTDFEGGEAPLCANYSCSKALLERVGCFDPRLGRIVGRSALLTILGEETHVARKLAAQGFAMAFCPAARVQHWMPKERLTRSYFAERLFQQGAADVVVTMMLGEGNWRMPGSTIARRLLRTIRAFLRVTIGATIAGQSWTDPARYREFGHLLLGAGGLWGLLIWPIFSLAPKDHKPIT